MSAGEAQAASGPLRQEKRLGELLVERGLLSSEQLASALIEQKRLRRPLGQILLENANLSPSITNGLSIDTNNKITGTNKLVLSFTTATGLFRGTVMNPDTLKPIAVNGALLQKQNLGFGYFLGTNQTGGVTLESQ